jgi:hypothetical protein
VQHTNTSRNTRPAPMSLLGTGAVAGLDRTLLDVPREP